MTAPSILWVKINEAFGFVGIAAGESMADLDQHLTPSLVDAYLFTGSYDLFCAALSVSLYLPDSIAAHLAACGWRPDDSLYACNGDVAAYGFRRGPGQ